MIGRCQEIVKLLREGPVYYPSDSTEWKNIRALVKEKLETLGLQLKEARESIEGETKADLTDMIIITCIRPQKIC